MANVRLNQFHNLDLFKDVTVLAISGITRLAIQNVYFPGSVSFNNVAMIFSGSGGVSEDLSLSFGLYSLNGSTLSLANSASANTGLTLNQTAFSWITLATSATQDITPGDWYFAVMSSTTLGGSFSLLQNPNVSGNVGFEVGPGGPLFRGRLNTNAIPVSIATSDVSSESTAGAADLRYPFVLISA